MADPCRSSFRLSLFLLLLKINFYLMERQVACQGFGECVLHTDDSEHDLVLRNVKCLGYSGLCPYCRVVTSLGLLRGLN